MMNFNVRIGYGYFILYRKNLFAKIYLGRVKKKQSTISSANV